MVVSVLDLVPRILLPQIPMIIATAGESESSSGSVDDERTSLKG
jgi:hypothetical protein